MKRITIGDDQMIITRTKAAKMQDKFNRAIKLAMNGKELLHKMDGFCGGNTESIRKQCALAFKVMWLTGMRVGNEESARGKLSIKGNEAFGLTTLKKEHVKIQAGKVHFHFTGKKSVQQSICIDDKALVKQLKHRYDMCEGQLFDGISDYHMRRFVQTYVGKKFQVKDVRTMRACMEFSKHSISMMKKPMLQKKREVKQEVNDILTKVAAVLGNTPAMAKRAYIDPLMIEWHITNRMGL